MLSSDARITSQLNRNKILKKVDLGLAAADSANLALIFAFKEYFIEALAGVGKAILFPFAAAAVLFRAILAIRTAYLADEQHRKGAILRAVVETSTALAITAAVIGVFVASTIFSVVAPIMFAASLGLKSLYHLGATIYFGVKGDRDKTIAHGVATLVTALATTAVIMVMILEKISFGIVGVIAGAIGTVYSLYEAFKPEPAVKPQQAQNEIKIKLDIDSDSNNRVAPTNGYAPGSENQASSSLFASKGQADDTSKRSHQSPTPVMAPL